MRHTRTKWSKRELRKIKSEIALEYGAGPRAQSAIEGRMAEVKAAEGDARAKLRAEYGLGS